VTKYFCDRCGVEIAQGTPSRVERELDNVRVEVMVAVKNENKSSGWGWNSGCVCPACVIKVVSEGKPTDHGPVVKVTG
jgi:DNA-directed RNA polymerase subunit RPC12/RpoP